MLKKPLGLPEGFSIGTAGAEFANQVSNSLRHVRKSKPVGLIEMSGRDPGGGNGRTHTVGYPLAFF